MTALKNNLTTKDVISAEMIQRLSQNTLVLTHSAGNPDIDKTNRVNAKTPYLHYPIAYPTLDNLFFNPDYSQHYTYNYGEAKRLKEERIKND